jgi:K+-sensing histidine kinase KdpD
LIIIYEDNLIEKNILIKINIPVSHQSIYAESVSLKNNVLGNILSNSIKFTPANGTISISSKKEGKYITLIIKDSGKGFDQRALEFFNETELAQMDQAKLSKDVGLKVIKNYIEMNQAKIQVYNNSGAVYEISFLADF